jgi:cyclopropane-fatty-acyl-phospholipid synthase
VKNMTKERRGRPGAAAQSIAGELKSAIRVASGVEFPLRIRTWDGGETGPAGAPTLVIRSPRAVRHVLRRPGQLGLARAFVAGDLDLDGDLREALALSFDFASRARAAGRPQSAVWPRLFALLVRLGAVGRIPSRPSEEVRSKGRRNSRLRDRAAIAHHYDLGNDFYEAVLDPSMAYSCGYWTSVDPDHGLVEAQRAKLDLVCRKLALGPGDRLLDIGCGWGSLLLHAAEHYGVVATGVTLSVRQHEFVRARAAERGLGDVVDVHLRDYRDIGRSSFDAVASIEMGEHVGEANYPEYCATLFAALRPGGRLLLQQMSRDSNPGGGRFIESYIAPDMTMRPLNGTLRYLENAGFEICDVQSLREHYTRTIDAWAERLTEGWDDVCHRFGGRRARVWRLYLAGSALAFESNRMGVHQFLGVRPALDRPGISGTPRPTGPLAAVTR